MFVTKLLVLACSDAHLSVNSELPIWQYPAVEHHVTDDDASSAAV